MSAYRCVTVRTPERLKELLAVFGEAFGELEIYQGAVPDDAYLAELLAKPHFIALAAVTDDRVIGGLAAYELEKFERRRSEIYIYDLAVLEGHRRRGVATALIKKLAAIARTRNTWVVFVQADRDDAAAIRLYESLGVREEVCHFDIPVEYGADGAGL